MDVTTKLHAGDVKPSELVRVVWSQFPIIMSSDDQTLLFARVGETTAIVVKRDSDGAIVSITATERVTAAEIDKLGTAITDACLRHAERLICRCILMSAHPLAGYLRVADLLQLLPVPDTAPQRPPEGGYYPVILEVPVQDSADNLIVDFREHQALMRAWLLLNAILYGNLTRLDRRGRMLDWPANRYWIMRPSGDGVLSSDGRKWIIENHWESYQYVGFEPRGRTFLSVGSLTPLSRMPPAEYYALFPSGERGALPSSVDELVRRYYSLDDVARRKFDRASHWFEFAEAMHSYSYSAALVAYVLGIDALVPAVKGGAKCTTCGLQTGPGPTKRFVDFLESTVPEARRASGTARKLYATRSKLVHGGDLLNADFDGDLLSSRFMEEEMEYRTAAWLTQLALTNWLSN